MKFLATGVEKIQWKSWNQWIWLRSKNWLPRNILLHCNLMVKELYWLNSMLPQKWSNNGLSTLRWLKRCSNQRVVTETMVTKMVVTIIPLVVWMETQSKRSRIKLLNLKETKMLWIQWEQHGAQSWNHRCSEILRAYSIMLTKWPWSLTKKLSLDSPKDSRISHKTSTEF